MDGSFESKIQKKLKAEKVQEDRVNQVKAHVVQWCNEFFEVFAYSEKKSFKDNLMPFFATPDMCVDYVKEPYCKYDDRTPDKWHELLKSSFDEGKVQISVLSSKEDSTIVKGDSILVEQMREKKGGQIVEISARNGEKDVQLALCELSSANWVIVICREN